MMTDGNINQQPQQHNTTLLTREYYDSYESITRNTLCEVCVTVGGSDE